MVDIWQTLATSLPPDTLIPADHIEPRYLGDWMLKRLEARPAAIARPRTTGEVATVLRVCHAANVPVVAQGGRTGLAGGATPDTGWVVLSTERMTAIGEPNTASASMVVEAGAVLQNVQQVADAAGLLFPLDIGARGSCTIGGNISTNAGGNHVLRYGMMRELVLGLESVLADGTVISAMSPMLKNNTGYDLKQLLIGAEGTLGVVTGAVLRLFPKPHLMRTGLCAVADYSSAVALLDLARVELGADLNAFEVLWPDFYRLGTLRMGRRMPLPDGAGAYVLVETGSTGANGRDDRLTGLLERALAEQVIVDGVIAQSEREREELWTIRDTVGEMTKTFWPCIGFDVSVPIGDIGRFMAACRARLAADLPTSQSVWFGHIADSNIHITVRVPEAEHQPVKEINRIVYDCVQEFAGSISAEHGIGLLKKPYLSCSRSDAEIAMMRTLKSALDPRGILNPGKIF